MSVRLNTSNVYFWPVSVFSIESVSNNGFSLPCCTYISILIISDDKRKLRVQFCYVIVHLKYLAMPRSIQGKPTGIDRAAVWKDDLRMQIQICTRYKWLLEQSVPYRRSFQRLSIDRYFRNTKQNHYIFLFWHFIKTGGSNSLPLGDSVADTSVKTYIVLQKRFRLCKQLNCLTFMAEYRMKMFRAILFAYVIAELQTSSNLWIGFRAIFGPARK